MTCPHCGHVTTIAAKRRTARAAERPIKPALTATTAVWDAYYKAMQPYAAADDLAFFLARVASYPAIVAALGTLQAEAFTADGRLRTGFTRTDFYRQFRAIQDQWRIASNARQLLTDHELNARDRLARDGSAGADTSDTATETAA